MTNVNNGIQTDISLERQILEIVQRLKYSCKDKKKINKRAEILKKLHCND